RHVHQRGINIAGERLTVLLRPLKLRHRLGGGAGEAGAGGQGEGRRGGGIVGRGIVRIGVDLAQVRIGHQEAVQVDAGKGGQPRAIVHRRVGGRLSGGAELAIARHGSGGAVGEGQKGCLGADRRIIRVAVERGRHLIEGTGGGAVEEVRRRRRSIPVV